MASPKYAPDPTNNNIIEVNLHVTCSLPSFAKTKTVRKKFLKLGRRNFIVKRFINQLNYTSIFVSLT